MIRHLGAFAFYLALAIAVTWPLATQLATSTPDLGDPLLIAWILDWSGHALTHAPLRLFHAPIYHPAPYTFAFSEHMTGIALVVLPLQVADVPAMALYNVALLLGLAFSSYGAFVLARLVTGNTVAALIAGVIHGFASFTIGHVQHLQIVWSGWLPLMLAALLVYWRRPDPKRAALLGLAFLMNGLTSVHWLLFGGFTLVMTVGFLQFAEPRRERAFWLRLAGALAIASLLLLPFLIPYQIVSDTYDIQRTSFEARGGSALPWHWLVPSTRNVLWGGFGEAWRAAERELFPGALAIVLVIVGLATRPVMLAWARGGLRRLDLVIAGLAVLTTIIALQERVTIAGFSFSGPDVPAMITLALILVRIAPAVTVRSAEAASGGVWLITGFLASLGWNFFLYPFLFRVLTPFRATRTPARWAAIAYVGIAVLAAVGAAWLLARSSPKMRRALAAALLAIVVVESMARIHWVHVDDEVAPVYEWLRASNATAAIELPMIGDGIPFLYLLAQMEHRVPLINGTSGWETPLHERLRVLEKDLAYGDEFLSLVERAGGELVIVHEARLSDEQRAAMGPMLAKLEPVQRFDVGRPSGRPGGLQAAPHDAVFRTRRGPADTASAPRGSPPR